MRKKILAHIFILVLLSGLFGVALKVQAEDPLDATTNYELLSPLPGSDGPITTYEIASENPLGSYLNTIITLFIGICAVLAMIMIVVGGLEYMTSELVSSKESGKSKITQAIFGLVLALAAWTILNTINPELLNTEPAFVGTCNISGKPSVATTKAECEKQGGVWSDKITVTVDLEADVPQTPVGGKYSNGAAVGANWATVSGMAATTLPSWLSRNSGECQKVGDRNCTSTRGLTGQYINAIHAGCPSCQLTLTAGTEFWLHGGKSGSTSHGPGSPTIDLRTTPELTKYIMGNKKPEYYGRYEKAGMSFLYEKNHWHVGP